jgi:hypothetical protein
LFVASVQKIVNEQRRGGGENDYKTFIYFYYFLGKQTGGSIPLWTKLSEDYGR